jgi:hypothetical protein
VTVTLLDLTAEARVRAVDLPDLPSLTPNERQMAVRTWRGRMVNEHISARVFAGLLPQLMAAGVSPSLLAQLPSYMADELRHAEQCAAVVMALGGEPVAPLPAMPPVPAHEDASPQEAMLRNVLSVCCLSETVAVSIIRAEQAELEGTALGDVLNSILADEVRHARFGWELLGAVLPTVEASMKQRLSAYLEVALAHQIAHEIPKLPVTLGLREEVALAGVCDGAEAQALFYDTIALVIVPQLEALGLDARDAWARVLAA